MKRKFSKSWKSSKQPRKQRKYRANAPLHIKRRFLGANLSKELRKKHGRRTATLRKGDTVRIMKGGFSKKTGKIIQIDVKKTRVAVEGIQRKKRDGSRVNVWLHPSNLQIISMNLDDKKRLKSINKGEVKK